MVTTSLILLTMTLAACQKIAALSVASALIAAAEYRP